MSRRNTNRRQFLMHSAAAVGGAGLLAARSPVYGYPANEKLNIAIVGVGGMGRGHVNDGEVRKENIIALCDIDDKNLYSAATEVYPMAEKFNDFRVMFDKMQKDIDAVICATPDHCHAVVTAAALRLGKHAYTQKPLTHTVYEAHVLNELAQNPKLATQMGNQGHSNEGAQGRRGGPLRRPSGRFAKSTPGPIAPSGRKGSTVPRISRRFRNTFTGTPGSARCPNVPTIPAYHPFAWRGWWDFGTGAGRHGLPRRRYRLLGIDLRHPTSIESVCEGIKPETGPKWSIINYEFPRAATCRP